MGMGMVLLYPADTLPIAILSHDVTDDGDFKTVVVQAGGWRS
jgi:hypothetical protein